MSELKRGLKTRIERTKPTQSCQAFLKTCPNATQLRAALGEDRHAMYNGNKGHGVSMTVKTSNNQLAVKIVLNAWTILTIALFCLDFFSGGFYDTSTTAISTIYLALLGIYGGEKEYLRWKYPFRSRFAGDLSVVVWTFLLMLFVLLTTITPGVYKIPQEFAIVYTGVVGVFAVTQHSKALRVRGKFFSGLVKK